MRNSITIIHFSILYFIVHFCTIFPFIGHYNYKIVSFYGGFVFLYLFFFFGIVIFYGMTRWHSA